MRRTRWKISPRLGARLRPALGDLHAHHRARQTHLRHSSTPTAACTQYRRQSATRLPAPISTAWGPRVQRHLARNREAPVSTPVAPSPPSRPTSGRTTSSPAPRRSPSIPALTAAQGAPVPYGFQITPAQLPLAYTPEGAEHLCQREHQRRRPPTPSWTSIATSRISQR